MDDELKAFIAKNRKRKSVFDDFRDDIFVMIKNDVSQQNIVKYLKSKLKKGAKGLTQPNLSEWLKRQVAKKTNARSKPLFEHDNINEMPEQDKQELAHKKMSKFEEMIENTKD